MKISTETTTGMPRPPFRMIAPSGAPMKKKIRQANDSVILLCHSVSCLRMFLSLSVIVKLLKPQSFPKFSVRPSEVLMIFFLSSNVNVL